MDHSWEGVSEYSTTILRSFADPLKSFPDEFRVEVEQRSSVAVASAVTLAVAAPGPLSGEALGAEITFYIRHDTFYFTAGIFFRADTSGFEETSVYPKGRDPFMWARDCQEKVRVRLRPYQEELLSQARSGVRYDQLYPEPDNNG